MKNRMYFYALVFLFVFTFFSCDKQRTIKELTQADTLMQTSPDSALLLLESIPTPEKMKKKDYALYCLLLTEARDKNYYQFTSDSVIRVAAEYYEATDDKRKLLKTYYYMGRVYQELKEIPYALEYYLKAENSIQNNIEDARLMSRIYNSLGSIYTMLHIYDDAMEAYKNAERYLVVCGDSVGIPFVLRNMARIYHVTEKQDSAVLYYKQTIEKAKKIKNQRALISSLIEIAGLYTERGDYKKASACLSEVSGLKPNKSDSEQLASVYARYYHYTGKIDSALFFLNQCLQSRNSYTKTASYHKLYQIAKDKQEYKQALDYADQYYAYKDTLAQKMEREESLRIQNLYNYQKIIRENEQLQHEHNKKQQQIIYLFCLFLFSFLLGILFFFYQKLRRKNERLLHEKLLRLKEESYKNSQKQLTENLNQIKHLEYKLQENEQKLDQAEKNLIEKHKDLLQQDNIRIELASESKQLQYERFYSTSIYNQLKNTTSQKFMPDIVWKELKTTIDEIFDQFGGKLTSHYPKISEKDLRICYLIKTKFSVNEIADFLGLSKSAISQSRKRMYEKIYGIPGSSEDLDRFIDSL